VRSSQPGAEGSIARRGFWGTDLFGAQTRTRTEVARHHGAGARTLSLLYGEDESLPLSEVVGRVRAGGLTPAQAAAVRLLGGWGAGGDLSTAVRPALSDGSRRALR